MQIRFVAFLLLVVTAGPAESADVAQSILRKARDRQVERWQGVDAYLVDRTLAGNRAVSIYERFDVEAPDGGTSPAFRPYRATGNGVGPGGRKMTPEELEIFADAAEMTGEANAKGIEDGLEQAGLPRGLLAASGSDPTATFDPRVMMGANAEFLRGAAEAERANAAEAAAGADETARHMAEFERKARLVGMESVDGRDAFHLRAEDLNQVQQVDGEEFTLRSVSLWLDSTEYVPLRTRVEGVATTDGGESREFTIERHDSDYREVAGSRMYEPFRQVVRIAGVMNDQQRAELLAAQKQVADMERQLAEMPPAQRQMIMDQMGPQMQMMKSMASTGGLEAVTEVHRIVANPSAADVGSRDQGAASMAPAAPTLAGATPASAGSAPASSASQAGQQPGADEDALRKAQEAYLKEKVAAAQASQKKKQGLGSLLSAAGRVAGMLGSEDVTAVTSDIYSANATAEDLASAARDLGITEDEIEACRQPG
jgi:hypothetical protein